MAEISAKLVKDLRDKSGAGMMACKKALVEANGDIEGAIDYLRKAGATKAAKKSGRATKEGLIAARIENGVAVMVELVCETDFVAKNTTFRDYLDALTQKVLSDYTEDGDLTAQVAEAEKGAITDLVANIGENMQIRRVARWQSTGSFGSYMHMGGKIGVLVQTEGEVGEDMLNDLGMHIAAFSPKYIVPSNVPAETIAKEKEIAEAQVQGKPANIMEKIVGGKIDKWYSEVCLMRQPWIRDDKSCLEKVAPKLTVGRFLRWVVGEEI
jgi:elongation factor Ts